MVEITQAQQKKERRILKNEDSLRDLSDNIKHTNIHIIRVPGEEREKGAEKLFEGIIAENFPNLGKEIDIHTQEADRILIKMNPKRSTSRNIMIKMTTIKD